MSEEEWDFVDGLKRTRSSCVCMTCQHFSCVRPELPHVVDVRSSTSPGPSRRTPHQEVPQLDGPQGSGNGLVPGGGVMREGWLIDGDDRWIWRFWRDESAWVRDPKVFLDRGRSMPDGPPLLKERRYLRKDQQSSCGSRFRRRDGRRRDRYGVRLPNLKQ